MICVSHTLLKGPVLGNKVNSLYTRWNHLDIQASAEFHCKDWLPKESRKFKNILFNYYYHHVTVFHALQLRKCQK